METKEKNLLVTLEERERISNEAIDFGKDGIYIRTVNFKKEIKRIQENRKKNPIVTLIPIKEDIYKNNLSGYTCVKDPLFGVTYGIPLSLMPDGNIRWRRILIEEKYSFNLSIEKDCMEYIVMRMHPDVEGSPFENATPKYRIYDPEREADKTLLKTSYTRQCFKIIDEISGKNLVYFCRNLGILQESDIDISVKILRARLEEFAVNDSSEFMRRYEQESRSLREIFKTGLSLTIIKNKGADGFEYNGRLLGLHEDSVITYMKNNPEVSIGLAREIEENDPLTIAIQKEEAEIIKKSGGGKNPSRPGKPKDDDM